MTTYEYTCHICDETKDWKKFVVYESQTIREVGKRECKSCFNRRMRSTRPLDYGRNKAPGTLDEVLAFIAKKTK